MQSNQEKFYELAYYTLAHLSPAFIHQHFVDAFAAEEADEETKPIKITFALIGLFLYLEKGYTGREVQQAHMELAKKNKLWPSFVLPKGRGNITVGDVLAAPAGPERDEAIHRWCVSVWAAYSSCHEQVESLVKKFL